MKKKQPKTIKQRMHDFTVDVVCRGLKFTANHWHNIKAQLLLASAHGLLQCFGIGGSIAILMKVKKQYERKQREQQSKLPGVRQGSNPGQGREVSRVQSEHQGS